MKSKRNYKSLFKVKKYNIQNIPIQQLVNPNRISSLNSTIYTSYNSYHSIPTSIPRTDRSNRIYRNDTNCQNISNKYHNNNHSNKQNISSHPYLFIISSIHNRTTSNLQNPDKKSQIISKQNLSILFEDKLNHSLKPNTHRLTYKYNFNDSKNPTNFTNINITKALLSYQNSQQIKQYR